MVLIPDPQSDASLMCGFWSATGQWPPVVRQAEVGLKDESKFKDDGGGVLTWPARP